MLIYIFNIHMLRTGMPSGSKHWTFPKEKVTESSEKMKAITVFMGCHILSFFSGVK